jgi:UDP-N-acetylmuramyl pentapeptide phosphotransferase/UDP-N-acetylglucosamine-1-phosphate transferase
MDGINGITGIYSITAIIGFYIINLESKIVDSTLLIFVCLSLIVFGYFNFRKKARFFAGDIGSITIACFFFYLTVLFYLNLEAPVVFLLFLVYMSDAVFTLLYRKKIGENITQAHRHHLYQKFTDIKKWPHLKTAIIYSSIQLVLNILVYMTYNFSVIVQWGIVFVCIVFAFVFYIYLFNGFKKVKK